MPRAPLIRTASLPYHVVARSNNREWFYLPTELTWEIFSELLCKVVAEYRIKIHAFVLMSNHFHLLATTPEKNLDEAMLYFMRETAREINRTSSRINHIFGGPYKWSVITHKRYYEHAVRYVYQNPVKAGIVDKVESYPFSTLLYLYTSKKLRFPIAESCFDRDGVMDLALWQRLHFLNTRYTDDEEDSIRRAFRHSQFRFCPHRHTKSLPLGA